MMLTLLGACYIVLLFLARAPEPDSSSVQMFYRLFYFGEPVPIGLLGVFAALTQWYLAATPQTSDVRSDVLDASPVLVGCIALSVATLVTVIALVVLHDYPFSMDEFGAVFQARLFAAGRLSVSIPAEWREHAEAITPVFVNARPADSAWVSLYLPGNALIRAPFERAGVGWMTGVLLAILCVAAISGIARRLWPNEGVRQLVAIGALALSTQFLVVAGTPYAMTAHLAVNLCWLYVWVRGGPVAYLAGPIGMVGILLHQPVPHLLFAAPFGVRLLRDRQWRLAAWMGLCYGAALYLSLAWHEYVGFAAATGGLISALAAPQLISWHVALMHLVLLATWQTPLAALSLVVCLRRVGTLRPLEQDLLGGLLISLVFYVFFRLVTQGHGWGWRYGHQALGNIALICATAWPTFERALGSLRARRLALASIGVTIFVQVPVRATLLRNATASFADAARWLRAQDADVVIVPNDSIWYGRDLVRNDPALSRPILVYGTYAADSMRTSKPLPVVPRVRRISVKELVILGLEPIQPARRGSR